MSWKCKNCGLPNDDSADACAAMCGYVCALRLILREPETVKEARFNISTEVGRGALQSLSPEDARFASQPQFKLILDAKQPRWYIGHIAGATNPTYLNNSPLTEGTHPLNNGDTISIGPKRLKLSVRLERID